MTPMETATLLLLSRIAMFNKVGLLKVTYHRMAAVQLYSAPLLIAGKVVILHIVLAIRNLIVLKSSVAHRYPILHMFNI
jgi:hypothetical protein